MGYCTKTDIENIIAQALTTGTSTTLDGLTGTSVPLLYVGNRFDNDIEDSNIVDAFISIADSQIDGTLSELYDTPFSEIIDIETTLFSNIEEYNEYIVLEKVFPLSPGDQVIIIQGEHEERHVIASIISPTVFSTEDPIQYFFTSGARIVRVTYPNPIRWISARISAANLYDKYFAAESSPNTSEFGNKLREIAGADLNNVLNGTIILHGQHRIGRRFYNANLVDQYGLPVGGAISKEMRQIK